ncbi:MAG: hypothetical protein RIR60_1428 [Pseudomonadota bacterium]|jgi:hypothetical protein
MAKRYTSASIWPLSGMEEEYQGVLKKLANSLTVAVSVLLVAGFVYVLAHSLPLGDFIYSIAFCYLAIAVLNYLVFGTAKLWHKPDELN